MKLFTGSLPYDITKSGLSELSSIFGYVISPRLIVEKKGLRNQ